MTFDAFVQQNKPRLQDAIRDYIAQRKPDRPEARLYQDSLDRLCEMTVSGKMLRGLFVMMIASFHNKELMHDPRLMHVAAAMEFMQTALLIHDDIIDNDRMRRGMKTIFVQYAEVAADENIPDAEHYGKSLAICAGDIAIFLAFELLSCNANSPELNRLVSKMAREIHLVAVGEMMDVDMASRSGEPTISDIMKMYIYKTSRYSFSLPFALGATFAGADTDHIAALEKLGENIGVLFQIQDDWLGLYGDEKTTGKPVGSDLREKKKTLYRSTLYKHLSEPERQRLETMPEVEVLKLFDNHRIEKTIDEVKHCYRQESLDIIDTLPYNDHQNDVLREIVTLVMQRNK